MKHTVFILFGITGDLARRQLLPALYHLLTHNSAQKYYVIGIAQQAVDTNSLWDATMPFLGEHDVARLDALKVCTTIIMGDINSDETYKRVRHVVEAYDIKHGPSNRLIYCSTPAFLFAAITRGCTEQRVLCRQKNSHETWQRIVYEKPFGHDLISARALNTTVAECVDEAQVFRIDHYLTKQAVSNITLLRFTNAFFEPLWNNRYIDQVHIIAAESRGIEGRGAYYDAYGAVRDVVQNHLVQLAALIGMETPSKLGGEPMRDARLAVVRALSCDEGMYGQYDGYHNEPHVKPHSKTETYALLKCAINTPRWHGVPFYLLTGKKLAHKETVVNIKFKTVACLLAKQCPSPANWLTIQVAPENLFSLTVNSQDLRNPDATVPIEMSFQQTGEDVSRPTQAYEQALREVLRGEQAGSVRFDEIEAAWQFIDAVLQKKFPLYQYEAGSEGPQEARTFAQNNGIRWHV